MLTLAGLTIKPGLREIASHGWAKTVEPRVMQVLVALARARGGVVSRDALVAACWEGRAVSEDAIYRCVAQLRRVLEEGDLACKLETVARVGYRLVCDAAMAKGPPAEISGEREERAPSSIVPPAPGALNDLIGHIYDCAIDPTQWDDALAHLVNELSPADWDVATLVWEQIEPPGGRFVGSTGLSTVARDIYCEAYAGRTPWAKPLAALPLGSVVDTDEIIPREELRTSSFYKTFLSSWGMELAVVATLEREGAQNLGFAMPGPPGHDLSGLKRGLRLLAPHMQRAVRISRRLGEANLRAEAAAAAIERAPMAIVTLTAELMVVNANAKALALENTGLIQMKDGRFAFRDPAAQAQLLTLADTPPPASATIRLADRSGGNVTVLGARVKTQIARTLAGDMEGASIVLTIGIGERAPLIEVERLGEQFKLTAAEARFAVALARGDTLQDYASRRNVTMNALKFQLNSIYRKTKTESLAELVKFLRERL